MADISQIPLPEQGIDAFMNTLQQMQENKLRAAQTQEAYGNANKSQMLANFLGGNGGFGGASATATGSSPANSGTIGAPQAGAKSPSGGMDMNRAMALSGAMGLQTQVVNGTLITPFGNYKVGESEPEKRKAEAQTKGAEATLKNTSEGAMGALSTNASFDALDEIMKDPKYKNIAGTWEGKFINSQPLGMPLGAMLQRQFPKTFSKEDAGLAGQASVHFGNIVTGVAQKFKGPFKSMTANLINTIKPNMTDSFEVQQSKIKSLKQLSALADSQNELIAKYVNSGMDPTAAILKASKDLSAPMKNVFANINNNQSTQPDAQQANQPSGNFEVEIYSPQGKLVARGSKESAAKFLKDHKGHYQKVIKND